jgi:hypothetical protein
MKKSISLCCVLTFAILPGCGGGGSGDPPDAAQPADAGLSPDAGPTPDAGHPVDAAPAPDGSPVGPVSMSGAIQKGPFIIGANVVVSMLDPNTANPTGASFPTLTRTDLGEFDLTLPATGAAEIQTTGVYFDEVLGYVSSTAITLRALASFPVSGPREVHVNALTHLGHLRAKKLVGEGASFEAAIAQAEAELRAALPLATNLEVGAGTDLDILGGDSDANAYLFALSCVLGQAGLARAGGLQELITVVALDLENDGALGAALREELARGARVLHADRCTTNMEVYVAYTGSSRTVPDIYRALDFDLDGSGDRTDPDADGDGVPANVDTIVRIAGGSRGDSGLAVDQGGTVWAWGGRGPQGFSTPPLPVATPDDVVDGAAVGESSMATLVVLFADGRVGAWGGFGPAEFAIVPDLDDVEWIGSPARGGALHAIRGDGTVWLIEVGFSTEVRQITQIPAADRVSLSDNGNTALWVLRDGTVVGHDRNFTETYPIAGLTGAVEIVACEDGQFALAVDGDGDLWRWSVYDALVNDGTTATRVDLSGPVSQVSPDGRYVVLADGSVWRVDQGAPILVTGLSSAAQMSGGIVLLRDGTVVTHQLGAGTVATPEPVHIPR